MAATFNRRITLLQATAINMIDMVGIGPFVVIPIVIQYFNNSLFIWAWVFGAVIAFFDGMIWSELGAAYPLAGGTYNFLRASYGSRYGKLMSFLFVWQTCIQAPLVVASGVVGFTVYLQYLIPLSYWQMKLVGLMIICMLVFLLYRKIESIGKISVLLWSGLIITFVWIIYTGYAYKVKSLDTYWPQETEVFFKSAFWIALGQSSVKTIYCYLGYYNVCHLGGEIIKPETNIPKSIFISIICISLLYVGLNLSILSVIDWQEAGRVQYIISVFFEKVYGMAVAKMATVLILWIAFSSLFSVLLGYSRIPYAAAADGNFFQIFARLHPTKEFPHYALLLIASLAAIFSFVFNLKEIISAILAMRILVQFIAQAIGVVLLREVFKKASPFKMWLYPVPVIVSVAIWIFIFISTGWFALAGGLLASIGLIVFFTINKGWLYRKNTQ